MPHAGTEAIDVICSVVVRRKASVTKASICCVEARIVILIIN